MDRRRFVLTSLALVAAPLAAEAQQTRPTYRIGYLAAFAATAGGIHAFRDQLRECGYIEGVNVIVESRFAGGRYAQLQSLAEELVALKVDVIVAWTTPAAVAGQRATKTIPIVFANVSDPVRNGLVASLARPGGNLTGCTDMTADLVQRRLALLKELLPRVTRVGVLRNLENPSAQVAINEVEVAARKLGLELQATDVRSARDIEPAFAALTKARVGSLIVLADTLLANHRDTIAQLATRHRLPMIGWNISWTDAGALLSYGADNMHVQKQVVDYVDRILRGAKPGELPVEQPTKFELVINMKTAKALGLTIPPPLLLRVDHVIE